MAKDDLQNRINIMNESHKKNVLDKAEKAKNRSEYISYSVLHSEFDNDIKVFLARRIGRGHIGNDVPCQDYCMSYSGKGFQMAAVADGVSSCKRSDVGAKLICEAVRDTLIMNQSSCEESQFANWVESFEFRKQVISRWVEKIKQDNSEYKINEEGLSKEQLLLYGSTLMYVVVTENKYILGLIGDGQIILFNDDDYIMLRKHGIKESSVTTSVVDSNSIEESFICGSYPREEYNGVLISTDGIYDYLQKDTFYIYAKQLKQRFIEKNEPYQPFCFYDNEQLKDISRINSTDDCSIALLLDAKPKLSNQIKIRTEIIDKFLDRKIKYLSLINQSENLYAYHLILDGKDFLVNVVKRNKYTIPVLSEDVLNQSRFFIPSKFESWESEDYFFNVYELSGGSLEFYYCDKFFREKADEKYGINASAKSFRIIQYIDAFNNVLDKSYICLNENAHFLVRLTNQKIVIYPEAFSKKDEINESQIIYLNYFKNLIGYFSFEGKCRPLYNTGIYNTGKEIYRFDTNEKILLCSIIRKKENDQERFYVKNLSDNSWIVNGNNVNTGDMVPLIDGLIIEINNDIKYEYHRR